MVALLFEICHIYTGGARLRIDHRPLMRGASAEYKTPFRFSAQSGSYKLGRMHIAEAGGGGSGQNNNIVPEDAAVFSSSTKK